MSPCSGPGQALWADAISVVSLPAAPVTAQVSVCMEGRVAAGFCPFPPVLGFDGSACDAHGEEGVILGLLVVPHAITLYLGVDVLKLILDVFWSLCFS